LCDEVHNLTVLGEEFIPEDEVEGVDEAVEHVSQVH
jgi:hypothetical protein